MDLLLAVCRLEEIQEVVQEQAAEVLDVAFRVLADQQDLADMAFALDVAAGFMSATIATVLCQFSAELNSPFKAVFIPHLTRACLPQAG